MFYFEIYKNDYTRKRQNIKDIAIKTLSLGGDNHEPTHLHNEDTNFSQTNSLNSAYYEREIVSLTKKMKGRYKMNVNKRNNYQLTGSIHTLSLVSLPVTDIDESIAPCFDTLSSRENLSYSKINANKLVGDLFSYDEFKTAFDTILGGAGIESYSLSLFYMRFDSFDPEPYRDYAKLNRYLISALAVTYKVQNCYDSMNLFSQKQVSVAMKNKRFE